MRAFFLKLAFHLFAALPLPVAHALGAALGWLLILVPNRRRRTAETNLQLCFPEMSRGARRRRLRRNLIELGKSFTEIGALWTRGEKNMRRLARRVSGEDKLKKAIQRGKGLLLAMPHLGAWEMVNLYCSMRYPLTTMYRAPPMSQMGLLMRKARERFNARLVSADNTGLRALYKALERGEMVAILPDQVPSARSGSVFAPFFGIPAATVSAMPRLAKLTEAQIVPVITRQLPGGRGYAVRFYPPWDHYPSGDLDADVARMNTFIEERIREMPAQYLWLHRRFKRRPPGVPSPY